MGTAFFCYGRFGKADPPSTPHASSPLMMRNARTYYGDMYFNELVAAYDLERRDRNIFHDLMRFRVREILLVASLYDSFILESDGALSEQIYGEYYRLNLTSAPRVTCAYSPEAARETFRSGPYDLVILMAGLDFDIPLGLAQDLKAIRPEVPIMLLAMNNSSLADLDPKRPELRCADRVFVWNGYSKLFVGMIKYVEDLRNVDSDTRTGLVRVVLLVEDSVRYYSRYLPVLYSVVMRQIQTLIEEEQLVETNKILRMRGRPKILLATSYEEAMELYERYEPYILTVISDMRYSHGGVEDPRAGLDLLTHIRESNPDLPVLIQSSDPEVRKDAHALGAGFVSKSSESLARELDGFFRDNLGFGPFIFRGPDGTELARARNMEEFERAMLLVPSDSLLMHGKRNHFSAWLTARGEIRFARILRNYRIDDFSDPQEMRDFLLRLLDDVRRSKNRGIIPSFDESLCGDTNCMARLAAGSVGGKGRGLMFLRSLIDNMAFPAWEGRLEVRVPFTIFIGIDEFERFLETNNLWSFAYGGGDYEEIRRRFTSAALSPVVVDGLRRFLSLTEKPLAVRSSGLFEDMLMVPFSGIYDTYLIPNSHPDLEERLSQIQDAIRLTYASLFSPKARSYFETARYKIDEERMAIVIQEVVGTRRGRWFFPPISGTAQSHNYYPVAYLKPEDGLCTAALGLGRYVVEGGDAFRFAPGYPKLELVAQEHRIASSQRRFIAVDLDRSVPNFLAGEDAGLAELDIEEAESMPDFPLVASTFDLADQKLVPGISAKGPRIIDFANILQHEALPFAHAVEAVLDVGSKSMGIPIEIEYAVNLDEASGIPALYLLQIKPLIQNVNKVAVDLGAVDRRSWILATDRAMGNGRDQSIRDIIFVDPSRFNPEETEEIALEIAGLNDRLKAQKRKYVLIGPGRWGTRDRRLGIPVSFMQISAARVIVEADLPEFRVEGSLGSHFFHNVTSMNIGYFTVPWDSSNAFVQWDMLTSKKPEQETAHCVHLRYDEPIEILMDGRRSSAAIKNAVTALTAGSESDNIACE